MLLSSSELTNFTAEAILIAREAGKLVALRNPSQAINTKQGNTADLVTETDKKVEKLIFGYLQSKFSSHDFIGEESSADSQTKIGTLPNGRYSWIIDPIDGTTNYCHGMPFICISIGLCYGSEPVVG